MRHYTRSRLPRQIADQVKLNPASGRCRFFLFGFGFSVG